MIFFNSGLFIYVYCAYHSAQIQLTTNLGAPMAATKKKQGEPTVIKKYANRRLYDTGRSSYITLEDLCQMIKEGHDFVVYDAKSGEDLTRGVLTQIIADQESKGENLLPINFMRQLIGMYGENMQSLVPGYLEHSFETFVKNQEQLSEQINKSLGGMNPMNPFQAFEEISKKNMAMFEQAMQSFSSMSQDDKDKSE